MSEYPTGNNILAQEAIRVQTERRDYVRRQLMAMAFDAPDRPTLASRMAADPTQDWT